MVSYNESLHGKPTSDWSAFAKQEARMYYKNVSEIVQHGAQGKWKAEGKGFQQVSHKANDIPLPPSLDGSKAGNWFHRTLLLHI